MTDLKELSAVIITVVVAGLMILFRKELGKLIDWIVSFRRITKTKEGYSLIGGPDPEQKASEQPTKTNIASDPKVPSALPATETSLEKDELGWLRALNE